MSHATASRLAAVLIWAAAALALSRLVRPARGERRAALSTGALIAILDYAVEILADRLGWWRYHLQGTFLGLPPDLAADFFLLGYSFCLLYLGYSRKFPGRAATAAFVLGSGLILGTLAYFHNQAAAAQGLVSFGEGLGPGSRWFAAGNYFLMTVVSCGVVVIYRFFVGKWNTDLVGSS